MTVAPPVISALISLTIAVVVNPVMLRILNRARAKSAWKSHVSDTVRDFRESYAVLVSIIDAKDKPALPVESHITKLGIAPELLSVKMVDIGHLSQGDRKQAILLTSRLVNINREVETMVRLMTDKTRQAFFLAASELAEKFYDFAVDLLERNPHVSAPEQSAKSRTILFVDGTEVERTCFRLKARDLKSTRQWPANMRFA